MTIENLVLRQARLTDSIALNYVRGGAGPTLIFIHGAMGDFRSWAPQWDAFTSSYDCISYSRRYSFPNTNPFEGRSHNALVDSDDLLQLLDHLDIERAILIGSSYGGFAALAFAATHPSRVKALISVEAPMMRYAQVSEKGATTAKAFIEETVLPAREAFESNDNEHGIRILTAGIAGSGMADIPAHILERQMQNVTAARSLVLSDDGFPLLDPEVLGALAVPTLLISGAQTAPIHAEIFRAVCAAMPQAQSRIIAGSGHSVSLRQPGRFNAEVLTFLSQAI